MTDLELLLDLGINPTMTPDEIAAFNAARAARQQEADARYEAAAREAHEARQREASERGKSVFSVRTDTGPFPHKLRGWVTTFTFRV